MPAKASRDLWNVNTPRGPKYTIQWQLHVNKTYLICSCVINIELYVCVSLFCNVAKFGTEERKGTEIWSVCAVMVTDSFVLCGVSVYFFHPCFCWLGHHVALKFWGGDGVLAAITFFVLLSSFLLIYQKFSLLNPSPTSSVANIFRCQCFLLCWLFFVFASPEITSLPTSIQYSLPLWEKTPLVSGLQ